MKNNTQNDQTNTGEVFRQHLQRLSKDELVTLVEKYASEQFFTEVTNKYAGGDEAQRTFLSVQKKIREFFKDDELMYNPDAFSDTLDSELEKLYGFEKPLCREIDELIFSIIQEVEDAIEDGYLYDDYSDYTYSDSLRFEEFVARFLSVLSSSKKIDFLKKFDAALIQHSYSAFEGTRNVAKTIFTDDELPMLKNTKCFSLKMQQFVSAR